jgi:hypothetical protein
VCCGSGSGSCGVRVCSCLPGCMHRFWTSPRTQGLQQMVQQMDSAADARHWHLCAMRRQRQRLNEHQSEATLRHSVCLQGSMMLPFGMCCQSAARWLRAANDAWARHAGSAPMWPHASSLLASFAVLLLALIEHTLLYSAAEVCQVSTHLFCCSLICLRACSCSA